MPKLKRLSGDDVIAIFVQFGFVLQSRRGSHVKLRRVDSFGTPQILTIPQHRELDKGTIRAIFRQASRFITEEQLRPFFYTE